MPPQPDVMQTQSKKTPSSAEVMVAPAGIWPMPNFTACTHAVEALPPTLRRPAAEALQFGQSGSEAEVRGGRADHHGRIDPHRERRRGAASHSGSTAKSMASLAVDGRNDHARVSSLTVRAITVPVLQRWSSMLLRW